MQEAEAAHATCRYWSVRAVLEFRAFLRELDGAQDQEDAVTMIRDRCCRAVCGDDPELLCAVLAGADRSAPAATDIRFATAVAAMAAKKYECAYAAWDDGGSCWSRASDDPWVPDSAHAASVLMGVCEEVSALRGRMALDGDGDGAANGDEAADGDADSDGIADGDGDSDGIADGDGDSAALCDMMSGLST